MKGVWPVRLTRNKQNQKDPRTPHQAVCDASRVLGGRYGRKKQGGDSENQEGALVQAAAGPGGAHGGAAAYQGSVRCARCACHAHHVHSMAASSSPNSALMSSSSTLLQGLGVGGRWGVGGGGGQASRGTHVSTAAGWRTWSAKQSKAKPGRPRPRPIAGQSSGAGSP